MKYDNPTDTEILEFYKLEKGQNTDLYKRWCDEERLKKTAKYKEIKNMLRAMQHEIFHDHRNAHLRKGVRIGES